jgi:hypothetical protein
MLVRAGVGWNPGVVNETVVSAGEDSAEGLTLKDGAVISATGLSRGFGASMLAGSDAPTTPSGAALSLGRAIVFARASRTRFNSTSTKWTALRPPLAVKFDPPDVRNRLTWPSTSEVTRRSSQREPRRDGQREPPFRSKSTSRL